MAGERMKVEEVTMVTYGEDGTRSMPWPLSWSAVWVGALAAIALTLVFGLAGTPAWAAGVAPAAPDPAAAQAARNAALAAVTALLPGLVGGVIGGWNRRAHDLHALPDARRPRRHGGLVMVLIPLWLLGVPLSLILILFLLGVGR